MTNKAARNLFIFGSLFFFVIFLGLTVDTMNQIDGRAPEITKDVDAGKMVWQKYDCIGCHTILGNGSYFAPDMTKIVEQKPAGYLKQFLMDPRGVNPKAAMPKLGISSQEADQLLAFLTWISKVDTNGWPPKPILAAAASVAGQPQSRGQQVYQSQGCSACHSIKGIGGTSGPDLTKVGANGKDAEWHVKHLKDPHSVNPKSAMPAYGGVPEADLKELAAYLVTLK
ncbi:MAG: c-type cytochrome [Nitrospiraceae bacterium]|nr:c-type cytochrome [Nitrospiraceae bacterium]